MWEEILQVAISNGVWAVLFVALLIYQLKDSAQREEKYQQTIEVLTQKYKVVEDIKQDIDEIKLSIITTKRDNWWTYLKTINSL